MDWIKSYGPPWMTWLVTALLVQRERQRWHHEVTRDAYEREVSEGLVELAGLPGWRCERHGIGLALTAPDGEFLDVDFNDETGSAIDVWFFVDRVKSLRSSERWVAERRLWNWRPGGEVIVDGCEALVSCGAARFTTPYKNLIVLADELEARAAEVAAELSEAEGAARWLAALEPGGEDAHEAAYWAWLNARAGASERAEYYVELLWPGLTGEEAAAMARPFLRRLDHPAGRMIQLVRGRPDVAIEREVMALLDGAVPTHTHPSPVLQACAYLFERGWASARVCERFVSWAGLAVVPGFGGNPSQGAFAILALRHVPAHALALVRASLRSTTPICVHEVAGVLEAIDQRWCHRELEAARAEAPPEAARYLTAKWQETNRAMAQARANAVATPTLPALAPADAGALQALVSELRATYPDDWDGAWPSAR